MAMQGGERAVSLGPRGVLLQCGSPLQLVFMPGTLGLGWVGGMEVLSFLADVGSVVPIMQVPS